MNFQNNIKYYRMLKGWSQTELAKKLGVTKASVSRSELMGSGLKNSTFQKYADALGVPVEKLIGVKPTINTDLGSEYANLAKDTHFNEIAKFYSSLDEKDRITFIDYFYKLKDLIEKKLI